MSDFINQLPPSFREALERQNNEDVSEKIKAFLCRESDLEELKRREEEFTKTKREE